MQIRTLSAFVKRTMIPRARIVRLFLAGIFLNAGYQIYAAGFSLDFSKIDYAYYLLTGPGLSQSGAPQGKHDFNTTTAGTYELKLGSSSETGAWVKFTLSGGSISSVQWKDGDGSQTGGIYVDLPQVHYTLLQNNTVLKLKGTSVAIPFSATSLKAPLFPQLANNGQPASNAWDLGNPNSAGWKHGLFPGDYRSELIGLQTDVRIEWGINLLWVDDPEVRFAGGSWAKMNPRYYQRQGSLLNFKGLAYEVDITPTEGMQLTFSSLRSGRDVVSQAAIAEVLLLPGIYTAQTLHIPSNTQAELYLTVQNDPAAYAPQAWWRMGGGAWELYPPEALFMQSQSAAFLINGPIAGPGNGLGSSSVIYSHTFYELKREPDGAYYHVPAAATGPRLLRFVYQGDYNAGSLQYTVWNGQHQNVTPTGASLLKQYGDNRLSLDVTSLSTGHYLLEVRDEKGLQYYLRFEII